MATSPQPSYWYHFRQWMQSPRSGETRARGYVRVGSIPHDIADSINQRDCSCPRFAFALAQLGSWACREIARTPCRQGLPHGMSISHTTFPLESQIWRFGLSM